MNGLIEGLSRHGERLAVATRTELLSYRDLAARAAAVAAELAGTRRLVLLETRHPDIHYFPRADVRMGFLRRTDHHTYCPDKGNAAYWSIEVGGETVENAAWSYEEPFDEVSEIKGYLSFYLDRVNILGF